MNEAELIAQIRRHHRRRRFAMKIQQKLDRALESFVRVNATQWSPDLPEAERDAINREVKAMIKRTRDGEASELAPEIITSDRARAPADTMREESESAMAKLAMQLPVYPWIENMHGAGALGLATIVAETGDLSNYPNPAKVWKRLGFAPFDGYAGSNLEARHLATSRADIRRMDRKPILWAALRSHAPNCDLVGERAMDRQSENCERRRRTERSLWRGVRSPPRAHADHAPGLVGRPSPDGRAAHHDESVPERPASAMAQAAAGRQAKAENQTRQTRCGIAPMMAARVENEILGSIAAIEPGH